MVRFSSKLSWEIFRLVNFQILRISWNKKCSLFFLCVSIYYTKLVIFFFILCGLLFYSSTIWEKWKILEKWNKLPRNFLNNKNYYQNGFSYRWLWIFVLCISFLVMIRSSQSSTAVELNIKFVIIGSSAIDINTISVIRIA